MCEVCVCAMQSLFLSLSLCVVPSLSWLFFLTEIDRLACNKSAHKTTAGLWVREFVCFSFFFHFLLLFIFVCLCAWVCVYVFDGHHTALFDVWACLTCKVRNEMAKKSRSTELIQCNREITMETIYIELKMNWRATLSVRKRERWNEYIFKCFDVWDRHKSIKIWIYAFCL